MRFKWRLPALRHDPRIYGKTGRTFSNAVQSTSSLPTRTSPTVPLLVEICKREHQNEMTLLDNALDRDYRNIERDHERLTQQHIGLITKITESCLNPDKTALVLYGSTSFGLSSDLSDIDCSIFIKSKDERLGFNQACRQNQELALMRRHSKEILGKTVSSVVSLHYIQHPLLVVNFDDGSKMDLTLLNESFQNIRNSNLVRYYLKADRRLGQMAIYIRRWFEECGLKNSKAGLFNGYHILLTLIHFLQSEQALTPWQVLPVLCQTHPSLVSGQLPIEQVIEQMKIPVNSLKLDYKSHNTMSVSELLVRYFEFYSQFNFKRDRIYIEKGQARRSSRKYAGEAPLQLIDPYSNETVTRSIYLPMAFGDAVRFTCAKMKNGLLFSSYPTFPEAKLFENGTKFARWRMQINTRK
ncbi:unnamed protein product, partial [Mesorhabditis spiculigera]